ncbi:sodium-independent anion transporter [Acidovorax sp. FJL06]|nr:sodium-independent anion transporter [Acidovorax sp. FJL06]
MVVPQSVAYAALAGMPPITGVYASLLPSVVAALFGAAPRVAVGPTALTCLLVYSALSGLASPGSAHWVELAVWLALTTGALQLVLGMARLGWIIRLVNSPVMMAFTQAAAVLIIGTQLAAVLGLPSLATVFDGAAAWHLPSTLFGVGSFLLLWAARKAWPTFPTVLVVVLGSAAISHGLGYAQAGGAVIGELPQGFPALQWPAVPPLETLGHLLAPTLIIALVSFLEVASAARTDLAGAGGWRKDQELVGQGLAKIAAGLCGAFPTSASFSRTALNIFAGARSAWASVFAVGVVLLMLLFCAPVLALVPRPVLASVVLVAVVGLIKPRQFQALWRFSRVEACIALLTFVATIATAPNLYGGIALGMLLSLAHFHVRRLHPRVVEVGLHPDGSLRDRHHWALPPLQAHTHAIRFDAALDFATSAAFVDAIARHLDHHPDTRRVCLFAGSINWLDATGAESFLATTHMLRQRQVPFCICGLKTVVLAQLTTAGWQPESHWVRTFSTEAELMAYLQSAGDCAQPAPLQAEALAGTVRGQPAHVASPGPVLSR